MQAEQIASMEATIASALQRQQELFDEKLAIIMGELCSLKNKTPKIQTFLEIEIEPGKECSEPLDTVKSVPEFDGKQENYVSWRQAASAAYKVFEPYEGSSRHYQAVGILKNTVRGAAAAVLASFNTVFKARLDFTYADTTSAHVIKHELSLSRQGELPLLKYYDEIEQKLTLLTNKTIMTHDAAAPFISGLTKSLKIAVFPAQPKDLPSAFSLAQEAEASNDRSAFAATFALHSEEKIYRPNSDRKVGKATNKTKTMGR